MRKYSLWYIKYLTINKSLKELSNSSTYSGAYSEPKYPRCIFVWKELTAFSKKLHLRCLIRFWICLWQRRLKYCNFKTSNLPWKIKKHLYILYMLNKITLTTENRSTVLHKLFLALSEKSKILLCFYGGSSTVSTAKFSIDFIVTANLIFWQILTLFGQIHKNLRVSQSLEKIWSI